MFTHTTQTVGIEPTLPEGNWFLVSRLNRSATSAENIQWLKIANRWKIANYRCYLLVLAMVVCQLIWLPSTNDPGSSPGHCMFFCYFGNCCLNLVNCLKFWIPSLSTFPDWCNGASFSGKSPLRAITWGPVPMLLLFPSYQLKFI